MNDFDRYDFVISIVMGLLMVSVLLIGGPLWTVVPIGMACATVSLYRHLPLPPRRRR